MTVEELAKELMKLPNQQMPVFFETDISPVEVLVEPVEDVSTGKIITLSGECQGAILTSKRRPK